MVDAPVYLLVALGNPGPEYQFHRHNAGFMVGEELRRRHGLPALRSKFQGLTAEGQDRRPAGGAPAAPRRS